LGPRTQSVTVGSPDAGHLDESHDLIEEELAPDGSHELILHEVVTERIVEESHLEK
jgi:hypothetical protein